jgi:energy-coupling factor transporter ATP-binding protein EcfA2
MKIEKVKIREFKVLKNFEADIAGHNIFIMGDNAQGKSSIIQFLRIALGDQSNIPPDATGEGVVIASKDGGNYTFKVKFKDGKPVVEVTSPDGLKDSKKGTLAALTGAIGFDIDEFVSLSKTSAGQKKQVEIYKSFLDEEIIAEIDTLQAKVKSLEVDRTETGREEKRLKAVIESHPLRNEMELTKFKEVDTAALLESLNAANKKNETIRDIALKTAGKLSDISQTDNAIEEFERKIKELKEKKAVLLVEHEKGVKWLEVNKEIDTTDIQTQINEASETNKKAAQAAQLIKDREAHAQAAESYGEATANIESQKTEIASFIKEMAVPVDGLQFDDDMLIYKGVPVSEASLSTSEIMELGLLMKVAENKGLGILFLERGESLGAQRLKDIQEMAAKNNMQLIIEQVERGKGLHIEIMEG